MSSRNSQGPCIFLKDPVTLQARLDEFRSKPFHRTVSCYPPPQDVRKDSINNEASSRLFRSLGELSARAERRARELLWEFTTKPDRQSNPGSIMATEYLVVYATAFLAGRLQATLKVAQEYSDTTNDNSALSCASSAAQYFLHMICPQESQDILSQPVYDEDPFLRDQMLTKRIRSIQKPFDKVCECFSGLDPVTRRNIGADLPSFEELKNSIADIPVQEAC